MGKKPNTIIESLGTYLPPGSYSTNEIMQGCKNQIRFPLEKVSGIQTRRMAGKEEFSLDLAMKAVEDCLRKSRYNPEDIDMLICCNISRFDGPDSVTFEPSTSVKLSKHFGFTNAVAFDITNACAGMFTGIYIINAMLETGAIQHGMVVSGEYITHLTQTAQKEIESFMDARLACLTLGDAGAAVILEKSTDSDTGFQELDLQTFGRYSPYCTAKISEHGGWIMHTDSVNLADVAIKSCAKHSLYMLQEAGWPASSFQHLIMHQTSKLTLNSASREINNLLGSKVCHDGNTINNLEQRGNTASTSHFIALADHIQNEKIQSGDKVVFSISASGLTVGTALYIVDDLPDRMRKIGSSQNPKTQKPANKQLSPDSRKAETRIRIESVGTIPELTPDTKDTMELLQQAVTNCLAKSSYVCNDIGLLIYTGVYRNEYLLEPAYAALLAGKLDMNATLANPDNKKTLAFDIFNGAIGFLNACYVAQQMIVAGNCKSAMIVAAESENNADRSDNELVGVCETASAIILDAHPIEDKGFSRFLFSYQLASINAYTTFCSTKDISPRLHVQKDSDLEELYIGCIVPVVKKILLQEGIGIHQIDKFFPPQISSRFIVKLCEKLNIPRERFIEVVEEGPDLFSSSLSYGLDEVYEKKLVIPGDIGLLIAVGSGIQAGCAIYYF